MSKCCTAGLLLSLLFTAALAEVPVPPLSARVTDLTETLSVPQKDALERTLQAFEARKGSQIAVLIVPTTQPETIEQYSIRVAEKWGLGRKGIDDGVLLLIATNDRALRIEVGYGLEGVLPDAITRRIVSDIITPYFRSGDFFGGIQAGVLSMTSLVEGEPLPAPVSGSAGGTRFGDVLVLGLILVFLVAPMLRGMMGRFPAALVIGVVAAIAVWVLVSALLIALIAGLFAFVATLFGGIVPRGRSGYWPGGHGGSGYRGGGFGGGGGGFGGGGASGRW